jgi:hypothetical protein
MIMKLFKTKLTITYNSLINFLKKLTTFKDYFVNLFLKFVKYLYKC